MAPVRDLLREDVVIANATKGIESDKILRI